MEPTKIADAIRAAQEAANAAAPEMKEKAFEVVLAHLLNSSAAPARPMHAPEAQTSATPDTSGGSAFDTQRVATQLGISTIHHQRRMGDGLGGDATQVIHP